MECRNCVSTGGAGVLWAYHLHETEAVLGSVSDRNAICNMYFQLIYFKSILCITTGTATCVNLESTSAESNSILLKFYSNLIYVSLIRLQQIYGILIWNISIYSLNSNFLIRSSPVSRFLTLNCIKQSLTSDSDL